MAEDYYGYDEEDAPPKGRDNLFLWTVFILLLIGIAFACWLGSFYIFGHPEQPRAYRILKKLEKLDPPKRFEVTAAPPGEFLSSQKLFERYGKFSRLELERENAQLLRNYIKNYSETKKLVPYIKGRFNIIASRELTTGDMFDSGVVAVAQSSDFPQVLIEHVYTSAPESVPLLRRMLQPGLDMSIERTLDLSAVIHVERVYDGRLMFTVVPLLYGTYALKQGTGTFGLEPPIDLNLEAGVPITKSAELQEGMKRFAEFRRKHPIASADGSGSALPLPPSPELVRLDAIPEGAKVPETGKLPEMPVATPMPVASATTTVARPTPRPPVVAMTVPPPPLPIATPIPIRAAATPPRPVATPAPIAMLATPPPPVATPAPATPKRSLATLSVPAYEAIPVAATPVPRMSPDGVPLTPFIAANPAPGLPSANSGTWRVYQPGKVPPGRNVTPREAGDLVDRGDLGERLYLGGQFVVTASGENKAVLRPQAAADSAGAPVAPTRIIVEYPLGALPPAEGSTFARDDSRPFEVRDVRRGADGQVNIYVREITAAQ